MAVLSRGLAEGDVTQRIILQDHGHIGLGAQALILAQTRERVKVL